jgi:hypothetical protein
MAQNKKRLFFALCYAGALAGCISPTLYKNDRSPSLNACRYKTFAFEVPKDQTRLHWLSDPEHRRELENILRDALGKARLREAPSEESPDLWVRYSLAGQEMGADQSTGTVIMASDYRLAILIIELWDGQSAVWRTELQQVVGDVEKSNYKRARNALSKAFSKYPRCKS